MSTPAIEARLRIRRGEHTGHTGGVAPGHVQGNLAILPERYAADFLRFCQRNPQACPLLAVSEPGDPTLPSLGADIDIRTDVPRYRVWRDGELVEERTDIGALWRDDLVSFLIGCSFSFEDALAEGGIALRHVQQGRNVAMYRTNVATRPAGPFHGPLVVSMRPLRPADAIRAIQITSRFPAVHGAPVHIGKPELIGIGDLSQVDYGDPIDIHDDELPVFWACGVTPQAVAVAAQLPFCITHAPGCLLVTDQRNAQLASL
ncbi:MAG: putative hydro-lyase [Xenophilus sp.]